MSNKTAPVQRKKRHTLVNVLQQEMAADRRYAFLNIPYGGNNTGHRLTPRATPAFPGGDRIIEEIRECRYSSHDLSCVQLNTAAPATPRFRFAGQTRPR